MAISHLLELAVVICTCENLLTNTLRVNLTRLKERMSSSDFSIKSRLSEWPLAKPSTLLSVDSAKNQDRTGRHRQASWAVTEMSNRGTWTQVQLLVWTRLKYIKEREVKLQGSSMPLNHTCRRWIIQEMLPSIRRLRRKAIQNLKATSRLKLICAKWTPRA